jgi:hypothetical protein
MGHTIRAKPKKGNLNERKNGTAIQSVEERPAAK